MTYYYSPSTGGFYCRDIHGDSIPADCKELSDEEYLAIMQGQSAGHRIVPDADGDPSLTPRT